MHIHILGICGTFMGGIAEIARQLGFQITGSDAGVYPPMSTQLEQLGITLMEGDATSHLDPAPDLVIVGNAYSRGHPQIEYMLDRGINYISGPQWLAETVLKDRWVLAVSGTHGKTTTTSLLAWILENAGLQPGFLIGGIAENFGISARLGESPFFVIEADEYDTAFFDKRSKFLHYRPRTLAINNLEFDHADIFPDLAAIQTQFHHLIRTIPASGLIIHPETADAITATLSVGCWTPTQQFSSNNSSSADWSIGHHRNDFSQFELLNQGTSVGVCEWSLIGRFNAENALVAIAAATHAGVRTEDAIAALSEFKSVKRRLQHLAEIRGIHVYDDFAHHPTAIAGTLSALRQHVGKSRIFAVLEPRSNTMRMGVHKDRLITALQEADFSLLYTPKDMDWNLQQTTASLGDKRQVYRDTGQMIQDLQVRAENGDHIVIMSNGGFENLHQRLLDTLAK